MCDHKNTTEILLLGPGIVMCNDCGAIFDAYDPYNRASLEIPLTPGQFRELLVRLMEKVGWCGF